MEKVSNFGPPPEENDFLWSLRFSLCFLVTEWGTIIPICSSHHDVLRLRPKAAGPEPVNSETVS